MLRSSREDDWYQNQHEMKRKIQVREILEIVDFCRFAQLATFLAMLVIHHRQSLLSRPRRLTTALLHGTRPRRLTPLDHTATLPLVLQSTLDLPHTSGLAILCG
ncbi:hypothetical protein DdX_09319 [Ditylenchus destructor]|uniref:Uncharacterized protein n=1 Tax=Ditylenchus destructor TaxID=166010 RepID=A0AAD4N1I8_9BILA|nr:hypothetical protein DdX_09319 [Ditylenchus destructor]